MYRIDIGIDLGTSKVSVYMRDKGIVINQPSVIAYEKKEKKIIAVGKKAKKMIGKTGEDVIVAQPIKNGVISEYALAERMIKGKGFEGYREAIRYLAQTGQDEDA